MVTPLPDPPHVERSKAALESAKNRTIKEWNYEPDGIVIRFTDGTYLEFAVSHDREIVGVQGDPSLYVVFRGRQS